MKTLSTHGLKQALHFIKQHGRKLTIARARYLFGHGSSLMVVRRLKPFQNFNGGFGHGLEPDFTLPLSSPLASAVAFRIMEEIHGNHCKHFIEAGTHYFQISFNKERRGWYALLPQVNDFPHAPWWHYDPQSGLTTVDRHWGNPTAEILGYLWTYREYLVDFDPRPLVDYALERFSQLTEYKDEHEIYAYLRLFAKLPEDMRARIREPLGKAVRALVERDPEAWSRYTPQPLDFVPSPRDEQFGITEEELNLNLDFLVDLLEQQGGIWPSWEWGQYPQGWESAKAHWAGIRTLEALKTLKAFGRLA